MGGELNIVSTDEWMRVDETTGLIQFKSVVDSGATDPCAPPTLAPHIKVSESPGSRAGQIYTSASGKRIANLGEKSLNMMTDNGQWAQGTWQIADISRPLSSVLQMCKQGHRVIFGLYGGIVQSVSTGDTVAAFGVEDNVYVMNLWIDPKSSSGFARQG